MEARISQQKQRIGVRLYLYGTTESGEKLKWEEAYIANLACWLFTKVTRIHKTRMIGRISMNSWHLNLQVFVRFFGNDFRNWILQTVNILKKKLRNNDFLKGEQSESISHQKSA